MFFLDVTGFDCGGADVLRVLKFVFKFLDIILFIIPFILIVMISIDLGKNVVSAKEDDMKKNVQIAIKRIVYSLILFLVPTIVSAAINLLGNVGVDYAACINIAKTHDLSKYEIDYSTNTTNKDTPNFSKNNSNIVNNEQDSNSNQENNNDSDYIKLNETKKFIKYKKSFKLKATLNNVSGEIKWNSSNEKVATVDKDGKVTAKGGGLSIISAIVDGKKATCKVIVVRYKLKKQVGTYRTKTTVYYDGDKQITYFFRRQKRMYACSSEKVNGVELCTKGFKNWYSSHGCGTIATTAVVNAYKGNDSKKSLISPVKMRMVYEKNAYNWKSKKESDPYCNTSGNLCQLTRLKIAQVLNTQFNISATPYIISSTTGNEVHIERITNALAEGRPVLFFVNAKQAGTTKFTSQTHTLVMVGFADTKGNVIVLDSSHNGITEDTVEEMVNKYIGRGEKSYRGYIVVNNKKS